MATRSLSTATLSLKPSCFPSRCFRFLSTSFSPPISRNFQSNLRFLPTRLSIRSCTSITPNPSSELQKSTVGSGSDSHEDKLRAIRELFAKPGIAIDAYIIPSQDAHQSEFIADCFARRAYISGFTGSAGTAVVTKDKAALWTDGRYFLQAEKQLSSSWVLMRSGNVGVPTTSEWLNDVLAPGCRVGIDPFLFSYDDAEELKKDLSRKSHQLVLLSSTNLVDEIWKQRPQSPNKRVRVHDLKFAGVDISSKLSSLRSHLAAAGSSAIVVSGLDEIAWLLNLRGNDIPHSPVMYSYLIVETKGATLFVDDCKITPEVMDHLKTAGIEIKPYESILNAVESLADQGARLWLDTSSVNAAVVNTFDSACDKHSRRFGSSKRKMAGRNGSSNGQLDGPAIIHKISPIPIGKAIKNQFEIEGMKNCHLRDAAALVEFWSWLEKSIDEGAVLTEVEVSDRLLEFRSKQDGFLDTSFDTISGSGANGAIIHYKPEPESCSIVDANKLFLLDSGAQYVDGTTDITRTIHFGEPTAREKDCFTRVLKGHIALDEAVFPENTPGFVLDAFARSSLWKVGLDYRHGTGHGVGAALNVHEGPQSISFRFGNLTPLREGMIVSNEPGYYEDHAFGIRIENLLYVKEIETPNRFGGTQFLGFDKLTYVPIQCKMVDLSLMSNAELSWLNDYHTQVWERVSPLVAGSAREWLWENTRPLEKP
ncbi:hypothetical protein V2J09_001044 [Rumex salicifolius]